MSDGTLNFAQRSVAPSPPTTNRSKIWVDTDGEAQLTDSSGNTSSIKGVFGENYTFETNDIAVINSTIDFETYITLNYADLEATPTAQYRLAVAFGWNYNVASRNYIARFNLNGVPFGSDFQVEPKDPGNDITHWESLFIILDGATLGASGTIDLEFRAQQAGDEATTTFARFELFRVV
jgi:hypothetical protein